MSGVDQKAAIGALPHGGENLEIMAEAENYNEFLCDLVRRYSGDARCVVDFGAGIGTFSGCLGLPPEDVYCIESETASREAIVLKGFNAYARVSDLPERHYPYVFTINVFENIEYDAAALGRTEEEIRAEYLSQTSMGVFIQPGEVAQLVLFLCSDAGARITGQALSMN